MASIESIDINKEMNFIGYKDIEGSDSELTELAKGLGDERLRKIAQQVTEKITISPGETRDFVALMIFDSEIEEFEDNLVLMEQGGGENQLMTWYLKLEKFIDFLQRKPESKVAVRLLNQCSEWAGLGVENVYFDGCLGA